MAVFRNKLSDFIGEREDAAEICADLRRAGLLSGDASDTDVLAVINGARAKASRRGAQERAHDGKIGQPKIAAEPQLSHLIPAELGPFLSEKGLAWRRAMYQREPKWITDTDLSPERLIAPLRRLKAVNEGVSNEDLFALIEQAVDDARTSPAKLTSDYGVASMIVAWIEPALHVWAISTVRQDRLSPPQKPRARDRGAMGAFRAISLTVAGVVLIIKLGYGLAISMAPNVLPLCGDEQVSTAVIEIIRDSGMQSAFQVGEISAVLPRPDPYERECSASITLDGYQVTVPVLITWTNQDAGEYRVQLLPQDTPL